MQITDKARLFDIVVLVIVFAIIPIKLFVFMWYNSRKDKKKKK